MMASLAINKTHSSYSSTGKNLKKEQGDAKKEEREKCKNKSDAKILFTGHTYSCSITDGGSTVRELDENA
jgi:hypothetical protein